MGDTNAKNKKNRYTNLGSVYIEKVVLLFFTAIITIAFADTFEMTFIGALTTFSGILFDLIIVSKSNNGPRQKWPQRLAEIMIFFIGSIYLLIILYFITKDSTLTMDIRDYYLHVTGERAYIGRNVIKIIIVGSSIVGPSIEYFYNKPNDRLDDEE